MNKHNAYKYSVYYPLIFLLLATVFSAAVYAESFPVQIKVTGNNKTRTEFIDFLVTDCLKDMDAENWADVKKNELRQCVFDSRYFRKVTIEITEPVIQITVIERWTVLPIPMVHAGENSSSAGIFLIDTHFLGMGKKVIAGGVSGDRGNSFFISYRDPAIYFSNWTASFSLSKQQTDYLRYEKDFEIDGYALTKNAASLAIGYKFLPSLEMGFQLQFDDSEYQLIEPYNLIPENYRYSKLGLFIDYNQTDYHFYFQEGYKLRVQIANQLSRNDNAENVTDFELNYDWQISMLEDHALQIKLQSRITDSNDVRDSYKPNGDLGYRGVESGSIWASELHSVAIDYKIPIFNSKLGVWTIGPFTNHAIFTEYDTEKQNSSTAYGAAAYMFLKGIALPGIGIIVGKNDDYLGNFVSFSIGFGLN